MLIVGLLTCSGFYDVTGRVSFVRSQQLTNRKWGLVMLSWDANWLPARKVFKDADRYSHIVNPDMVWKPGELQSVYNELRFYVELASPCTNLLKFCLLIRLIALARQCYWTIASPKIHCLHRAQVSKNTNKRIEPKTLDESLDHIYIYSDILWYSWSQTVKYCTHRSKKDGDVDFTKMHCGLKYF